MARKDAQLNFRIPKELKDYLTEQAGASRRSLTAELVYRLEKTRAEDEEKRQT